MTGIKVGCRLWGRTESDTTEGTQQQQQQDTWILYDGALLCPLETQVYMAVWNHLMSNYEKMHNELAT